MHPMTSTEGTGRMASDMERWVACYNGLVKVVFHWCYVVSIHMYRDGLFTPMAILSMVSSAVDRLKEKAHSSVSTEWSIVEIGNTHRSGSPSYSLLSLSLSPSLPPSLFPLHKTKESLSHSVTVKVVYGSCRGMCTMVSFSTTRSTARE